MFNNKRPTETDKKVSVEESIDSNETTHEMFGNQKLFDIENNKKEKILPTQDLKNAFYKMKASTMPPIGALSEKREIVASMREGRYIDENVLKERKTIYVASGVDVEYPILLGARKIVMVDPYIDANSIKEIEERIINISGKYEKTQTGYLFEVDFGGGKEMVNLEIELSWYGPVFGDVSEKDHKKFEFSQNTGLVIGFASGGPLDRDPNLVKNLPSGSYIYDGYNLSDLEKQFDDYKEDEFIPDHLRTKDEIKKAYNKIGFEYVETPKYNLLRKL